jgi:membrane-associated phospholipid phosphatase
MTVSATRLDGTGHAAAAPLTKGSAGRLVVAGLLLWLGLSAVGIGLSRALGSSSIVDGDKAVSRWFAARRTPTLDTLTHYGTLMAETVTAIALTVILVVVLRVWLGRWRESIAVLVAILGELFVFLLVTNTVDRPRPPVPRLDVAPPTSSFPSGHTAAAVALYGCVALIVLRQLSNRWVARTIAVLCCCVPVIVAVSRVYRGMHYVTDVTFGAIGGGIWLLVTVLVVLPRATYGRGAATAAPSSRPSR